MARAPAPQPLPFPSTPCPRVPVLPAHPRLPSSPRVPLEHHPPGLAAVSPGVCVDPVPPTPCRDGCPLPEPLAVQRGFGERCWGG